MPCIRCGDLNVFYLENGAGTPVVFIHGNWATSSWWEPVLARLPDGLRGIAYDIRGRGRTVGPDSDYGIASLSVNLRAFIEALNLDQVDVVGHSLGGAIAMQFALENWELELVRTLTVVAPVWVERITD